jgi:hypothetical protein
MSEFPEVGVVCLGNCRISWPQITSLTMCSEVLRGSQLFANPHAYMMTAVSLSFLSLDDVNSIDLLRPEIAASREFQFFDLCLYPEHPTVSIDWVMFMTSAVAVKRSENRNVS